MSKHIHGIGHDPSAERGADVISFEAAGREHPRKTEVPVEIYLLSPEGRDDMEELYDVVDTSDHIVRSLFDEIRETLGNMARDEDPTIYSLFLHDDGAEALTRPELIELYKSNPVINAVMNAGNKKHHERDFQAQQVYTFGLRIFMNIVRYEWLTRTYNPADSLWSDRVERLGDFQGSEVQTGLFPGSGRVVIIPRHHTPSDYIDRTTTD